MTKHFKLKLSMFSFRFCRSKKSFSLPKSPLPTSLYKCSAGYSLDNSPVPVPPSTPDHPSFKHSKTLWNVQSPAYKFRKDVNLTHKTYNSPTADYSDCDNNNMMGRTKTKESISSSKLNTMCNTSDDSGWFSFSTEGGDDKYNDETESFISSQSFESSFDVDNPIDPFTGTRRRKKNNTRVRRLKRYLSNSFKDSDYQKTLTKVSVMEKLMPCMVDGKVNESFAIVKKSADPYEDFKKSMMEMIVEKQMFEADDLEQLLLCFLRLNTRHHHAIIVEAFTEIWEELFGTFSKSMDLNLRRFQ